MHLTVLTHKNKTKIVIKQEQLIQCGLEDPSNKIQGFTLFLDESHNFAEERYYNDNDALITDNFGSPTAHLSQPLQTSTSYSLTPFKSFDPLTMFRIAAKHMPIKIVNSLPELDDCVRLKFGLF